MLSLQITEDTDSDTEAEPSKTQQQDKSKNTPQDRIITDLPSYGSCPPATISPTKQQIRAASPTYFLVSNLLMGSAESPDSNNINSPTSSSQSGLKQAEINDTNINTENSSYQVGDEYSVSVEGEDAGLTTLEDIIIEGGETAEVLPEEGQINNINDASDSQEEESSSFKEQITTMATTLFTPILNKLLQRKCAADRLHQYSPFVLTTLSTNGKYASLAFIAIYALLLLLIWLPLWLLGQLITEAGVYIFLVVSIVYGGRCLLRLLAFPGTNVRVYGEIENEFVKYSCKMLEGGAGAVEDFAKCLRAGYSLSNKNDGDSAAARAKMKLGIDGNDGWDLVDVPATHHRVRIYARRILGVYYEVLHCLLEEDGQGYDGNTDSTTTNGTVRNGFYSLGDNVSACKDTCKRNLCCERESSSTNAGDYNLGSSSNHDAVEGGTPKVDLNRSPSSGSAGIGEHNNISTQLGNNPLVGDIGNMGNLTAQAKSDGRELYTILSTLLAELSTLESLSGNVLRVTENKDQLKNSVISVDVADQATTLIHRAAELREFALRVKPKSDNENAEEQADEEDVGAEAVRHRLEEQGTASSSSSTMDMVKSAIQAFVSMVDPPPHDSIFGLDVIRGTFLARYVGAAQFWIERSSSGTCCGGGGKGNNGKLDVIMIPSSPKNNEQENEPTFEDLLPLSPRKGRDDELVNSFNSTAGGAKNQVREKRKAVLYCNPNAGLVEVATGMGLTGGNVAEDEDDDDKAPTCWTEYYMEHGYDVYLFNYAGYGRSYGGNLWNDTTTEFSHGVVGALKRVLFSTFLAFKPSSESLKSDAASVARHLVDVVGVDELIIHGESIGGMAAAGAARALTATTIPPKMTTVLICDRTFCNLEAVGQRLVGQWTGNAIRLLTPTWSTDVARDFLAARCPKIVAQDCADEIIHDYSSLKSGVSFAGELTKGQTKNVGWTLTAPLEYRIADLDNVSIAESRVSSLISQIKSPPSWPVDKRISWTEAYHFAACVKRIGKLATTAKRKMKEAMSDNSGLSSPEQGIEVSYSSDESSSSTPLSVANVNRNYNMQKRSERKALVKLWSSLACCDGLCGHPLGHAIKEGFDCTIAWLCCTVMFGGQVLAEQAEKRWDKGTTNNLSDDTRVFAFEDFDLRPEGYQWDEDEVMHHPVPLPEVLSTLKEMTLQKSNVLEEVEAELSYVIGMLEYIISRLTSKENAAFSLRRLNGQADKQGVISTGCFLNLHCGHNNQYSTEEREKLIALIRRSCGDSV